MYIEIWTQIEHRHIDGFYTDAYVYLPITKATCIGYLNNKEFNSVLSIKSTSTIDIDELNNFLGKKVFNIYKHDLIVPVRFFPKIIQALPKEFPKEVSTNPVRKVKILVVE